VAVQLSEVIRVAEELWPLSGAEDWDAVGLVVGVPDEPVHRVLLAVDAVSTTVEEAVSVGAQLLLVHHPLLMRGVTSVAADRYKGRIVTDLARSSCALYAAHTNADVVDAGTSGVLARRLGLDSIRPIVPSATGDHGLGRIGTLSSPISLGEFARRIADVLPATVSGVRVAGDEDVEVRNVAVCGGAGDSLLAHPDVVSADVYVTSDLRHHPASESREQSMLVGGPALIDVSHWASESLWLDAAAEQLAERLPSLEISISGRRTDPWDFVVHPDPRKEIDL